MILWKSSWNIIFNDFDRVFLWRSVLAHYQKFALMKPLQLLHSIWQLLILFENLLLNHFSRVRTWLILLCFLMRVLLVVDTVYLGLKIINLPLSLVNLDKNISKSFASLNADLEKLFGKLVWVACDSHPDFASNRLWDAIKPKVSDAFLIFEFFIVIKDVVPSVLSSFSVSWLLLFLFFFSFHWLNVPSFSVFN